MASTLNKPFRVPASSAQQSFFLYNRSIDLYRSSLLTALHLTTSTFCRCEGHRENASSILRALKLIHAGPALWYSFSGYWSLVLDPGSPAKMRVFPAQHTNTLPNILRTMVCSAMNDIESRRRLSTADAANPTPEIPQKRLLRLVNHAHARCTPQPRYQLGIVASSWILDRAPQLYRDRHEALFCTASCIETL